MLFSKLLLRLLRKLEKTLAMKFVWQVASSNPFKDCKPTVLAQISPVATIGVARGTKGPCAPKLFENIVISCFERRFSKQNSVIRLKSNILPPTNKFLAPPKFLDWLRHWS